MRFAWLRRREGRDEPPVMTRLQRLLFIAYNVIWWVPVVLAILGIVSFWSGALGFLIISVARAAVNSYRINVMPVAAAERFPLRSP